MVPLHGGGIRLAEQGSDLCTEGLRRVRLRGLGRRRVVEGSGFLDSAGPGRVGARLAGGAPRDDPGPHDDTGPRDDICPRDDIGAPGNTGVAEDP